MKILYLVERLIIVSHTVMMTALKTVTLNLLFFILKISCIKSSGLFNLREMTKMTDLLLIMHNVTHRPETIKGCLNKDADFAGIILPGANYAASG